MSAITPKSDGRQRSLTSKGRAPRNLYNKWVGTDLSLLLFPSFEATVLGLGTKWQAFSSAGSWRPRSRPQLGLGCARAASTFSRLRHGSARTRQQRLGARRAVQHRRTRARPLRAGGRDRRFSNLSGRPFARWNSYAALFWHLSGSRTQGRIHRGSGAAHHPSRPQAGTRTLPRLD